MPMPPLLPDLGPQMVIALQKRIAELLAGEAGRQDILKGQADQSRSAYEGLAGAPLPQDSPTAAQTQQLFGDVASIISERPEFAQRTRDDLQQRSAMLLQQRIQNIQILRDRYQEDAAKIGKLDPIKALELQEKTERMNKLLEQLHERDLAKFNQDEATKRTQLEQTGALQREQLGNEAAIKIAEINSQAELMRWLASGGGGAGNKLAPDKRAERIAAIQGQFVNEKSKGIVKESRPLYKSSLLAIPPSNTQTAEQWQTEMVNSFQAANRGKLTPADVAMIREQRLILFPPEADTSTVPQVVSERPATYERAKQILAERVRVQELKNKPVKPAHGPRRQIITTVPSGR